MVSYIKDLPCVFFSIDYVKLLCHVYKLLLTCPLPPPHPTITPSQPHINSPSIVSLLLLTTKIPLHLLHSLDSSFLISAHPSSHFCCNPCSCHHHFHSNVVTKFSSSSSAQFHSTISNPIVISTIFPKQLHYLRHHHLCLHLYYAYPTICSTASANVSNTPVLLLIQIDPLSALP